MAIGDYDTPFEGMSEEDILYRAINENGPMYMGLDDDPNTDESLPSGPLARRSRKCFRTTPSGDDFRV